LILLPGVHPGPLTVAAPVRLVGEPGAIVEGDGRGPVLVLTADDILVSDLTVRGSGADLSHDDAVVLLHEAHRITVERCRIEARAFGIYLRAGGEHRIVDNQVFGDTGLPVAERGNGIHLWHTEGNEVRGNRLEDVRDGIYLSFAHDNHITGNQGNGLRYGIHYMYSERNVLEDNRFSGCSGGIALMFSMDNRIAGNDTEGNREFGILCQQIERSLLSGNRVTANGRGFYLQNSVANRFVDNEVAVNGVGVYLTAGSESNVFTGNRFGGNLVQVFEDRAGANSWWETGRGNAWSDYAGFDWNGDGVGEAPYRLQTSASALMARRPAVRWFWMSPALALLDWWQARLARPAATSFDPYPLVTAGTP
jgi:nitrous oxidase accessory protein